MHDGRDVDRLSSFTDGVIVISMTLLVLDIQLPADSVRLSDSDLTAELAALLPKYQGYVISFLVIANFWVIHTRKFRRLKTIDAGFLWLNILFLLVVGFVPFVTTVLSESDGRVATTLYATTMAVASAVLSAMGWYADRRGLSADLYEPKEQLSRLLRSLVTPAVFLVSVLIAQFNPNLALYFWLLLIPAAKLNKHPKADRQAPTPSSS